MVKNTNKYKAYCIECLPTGDKYIGITTQSIRARLNQHMFKGKSHGTGKFNNLISDYGRSAFSITHLASSVDANSLRYLEIQLIEQYNTFREGLNKTSGGDGVLNGKHTEECRQIMSSKRKEIWKDPLYREKISASQKIAWANKSADELAERRELAKHTFANNKPKKRVRKPPKPLIGRGHNMAIKTHCPSGHIYNEENTHINRKGSRVCKTCKRKNRNAWRLKK